MARLYPVAAHAAPVRLKRGGDETLKESEGSLSEVEGTLYDAILRA